MEDGKLLQLLQRDPNAGMEQLLRQYTGLVYTVVRSRLAGSCCLSSDAEDCVADVFSGFYAGLADFDPEKCSIKSYLCVMARNQAVNLAKKRGMLQGAVSLDDEQALLRISDDICIESSLERDALRREVLQAVTELGEPDRSILFRKFYYGSTSREIARDLGLSVSGVDTRTHRALRKLKKQFGGNEP